MTEFNVVYEYNKQAGVYEGTRYWTSFPSEAEFNFSEPSNDVTVVASGVDSDMAVQLCGQVDKTLKIDIALHEAGFATNHFDAKLAGAMIFALGLMEN